MMAMGHEGLRLVRSAACGYAKRCVLSEADVASYACLSASRKNGWQRFAFGAHFRKADDESLRLGHAESATWAENGSSLPKMRVCGVHEAPQTKVLVT